MTALLYSIGSDIKSRPARWGAVLVAVLLTVDVLSIVTWMTFPALKVHKTSASVSSAAEADAVSMEMNGLLDKVRSAGANPSLIDGVRFEREPFSVAGKLMTLQNDNVQVFEYSNPTLASKEAEAFLNQYGDGSGSKSWMPKASIYVDGNLVILYMGNRVEVVSTLTKALGAPLANS